MTEQSTITPLSDEEMMFVTYIEQVFLLKKELPSIEAIMNALNLERQTVRNYWNNDRLRTYLKKKDIVFDRLYGEVLTPLQLLTINTLLDFNDNRSDARKLKELGVSSLTYQRWRSDPAFQNYIAQRVNNLVGDNFDEIDRALYDRARSGDMGAIKFIYEFTGRYRGTSGALIDISQIIIKIQEILVRHLATDHPSVLEAIGQELQLVSSQIVERGSGITGPFSPVENSVETPIKGELL